jgi:hypothetical protein
MSPGERKGIFISYSHKDAGWMEQFRRHLKPLERERGVKVWADPMIEAGDEWYLKIQQAIDASCIAVLMVTPDFLASDFIVNSEIPMLRKASKERELRILWIAVVPARYENSDLIDLQAVNEVKRPIATLSEVDQDREFAMICGEIENYIGEIIDEGDGDSPAPRLLRAFAVTPSALGPRIMDAAGKLWIGEGHQIRVFHVAREEIVGRASLPSRPWKTHLQGTWQDSAVLADWNGTIHTFDAQGPGRGKTVYDARNDDVPVHRLAASAQGHLFAAAWNGVIRVWEPDGSPAGGRKLAVVPSLPLRLAALADGGLAVADQSEVVRCYSPCGSELWNFHSGERISGIWTCSEGPEDAVVARVGDRRFVKLVRGRQTGMLEFDSPIRYLSRGRAGDPEHWSVVACENGQLHWLSLSRLVRLDCPAAGLPIREIEVVADLHDSARLLAVALSEAGVLFAMDETSLMELEFPPGVRSLFADPTGRFLYLLFDRRLEVYRNPAVRPAACKLELAGAVQGHLKISAYCRLVIPLRNSGLVPIHAVQAELGPTEMIIPCRANPQVRSPLLPGQRMDLEFSVRANVSGDLSLKLRLKLSDEVETSRSPQEIQIDVPSLGA